MRYLRYICCLTAVFLSVGCADPAVSETRTESKTVSESDSSVLTAMLLHTESGMRIRTDPTEQFDANHWINEAINSHTLARSMLRTVTWQQTGDYLTINAEYGKSQDALRNDKYMLSKAAKNWCLETAGKPNEVRALLAHDYICRICLYGDTLPDCHGAAGALLEHYAACDGYAEAFALLMEYADIPAMIVTGQTVGINGEQESHAWNLVQLSGEWYHTDCTWDDTGVIPSHTYFLCNDAFFRHTHIWDETKYPPAQGGGYRYEVIVSEMADQIRKDSGEYAGYSLLPDSDR